MSKARSNPTPRARVTWDTALVTKVAEHHAGGMWLKHACALEGGSFDGLRDAMAREPAFAVLIEQAHAKRAAELHRLKSASLPGTDDWKKWAWDLERWDQATFHLTTKLEAKQEHSVPGGGPLQIVVGSIEELRALAKGAPKDGGE